MNNERLCLRHDDGRLHRDPPHTLRSALPAPLAPSGVLCCKDGGREMWGAGGG